MKIFLLFFIAVIRLYFANASSQRHQDSIAVKIKQYPYVVQFISQNEAEKSLFCSGSILTRHSILSVAHCFKKLEVPVKEGKVFVASGSDEPLEGQYHKVIDVKSHENYADADNDIAIIFIENPIDTNTANTTERPVSLPAPHHKLKHGSAVQIIGWDHNKQNGTKKTSAFMELNVKVIHKKHCDTIYRRIGLEEFVNKVYLGKAALQNMNLTIEQLNSSWVNVPYGNLVQTLRDYELREKRCVFCAGSDEKSSLQGNSGRLVFQDGFLVGLSSFNVGNRAPAVYTEVSKYLQWINNNIVPDNEEPKTYQKRFFVKNSSIYEHCNSQLMVLVLLYIIFI